MKQNWSNPEDASFTILAVDDNDARTSAAFPMSWRLLFSALRKSVSLIFTNTPGVPPQRFGSTGIRNGLCSALPTVARRVTSVSPSRRQRCPVQGAITRDLLVGKDLPRVYHFAEGKLIIESPRPDEHWSVTWEHY